MHFRSFLLLLLCLSLKSWAQENVANSEAYQVYDHFVGHTNSGVFDGVEYFEKHPVRNNKHKFFDSPKFQSGMLVYKLEPYFGVLLKYDAYEDALLARNTAVEGGTITLLDKHKISAFTISTHTFKNLNESTQKGEILDGFFEILYTNNQTLLFKKHRKKLVKKTENGVYYEFKDNPWYLLFYDGIYYKLKNENSLISIFDTSKKIKTHMGALSDLKDQDYDSYLVALVKASIN